ncbi:MAG: hypothetical protein COW00_18140 [Bdellovibrio sp. CG12_big_fil_rev_8_21_14_0_65_39_13]|nr:MAG: hypothetical protein COW78_06030 [Bdellovibrio sp. CG22_combo_CG10-13_8_21_14_all_39_27]PIQ58030.1 MAG: hypothetical protein COW00_18140 [Bdellovibrio sp. CG12_big_fil_rev_8_21_14_0_65_39_13]PIR36940.1 MAG: hypothetical protein COV37_00170 [Bdellovibrio sp. CG11_big_fil_rev_8_21_14_0_20_39_38]PJB52366.1 MAG: hypothetical protein CO099_12945 [Bdellovibrio sp. CG_4_9_14_3_um_filter_39_7]
MSQFLDNVNNFSEHYNLGPIQKLKILIHYPIFKLNWNKTHGRGLTKKWGDILYPFFKNYLINVKMVDKNNQKLVIPLSFDQSDLASFREIFFGLEYGEVLKIKDIQTVCDIGANTGMASLFFLANFKISKIVLVEANPALAQKLNEHFQDDRISVENLAIYGERGSLKFNVSADHRNSGISDNQDHSGDAIEVSSILMEDLLKKHHLENVDLLKIDIEGAEFNILEKTPQAFLSFKFIYIEIHGDTEKRNTFKSKLIEIGFTLLHEKIYDSANCEVSFFKRNS